MNWTPSPATDDNSWTLCAKAKGRESFSALAPSWHSMASDRKRLPTLSNCGERFLFCPFRTIVCLIAFVCSAPVGESYADETRAIDSETLRNDQLAISGRYDRFERLLSQMADVLGHEDPQRAELLRRAISKGREKAISGQLSTIAENLGEDNLGQALEQQEDVLESLATLLQLLQSEDRRSELEKERERLNNLLKDVSNTLSQQRSARASTQNSQAPSSSAPNQQKAINQADRVLDDIKAHEGSSTDESKSKDSESSDTEGSNEQDESDDKPDNNNSDENGSDSKPKEPGQEDTKPSQSPSSDSEEDNNSKSQNSSDSQNSDPQQTESQQTPGSDGSGDSDAKKTPGRKEVAQARQYMQEALEQLQEQLREKALDKQDDAIRELQKAVEELRKKLLQLREEEKEMILASLEARFQRMLAQQTQIYDETVDLNETPVAQWLDTMFARSREVAQQQAELQIECNQTLGLLQEDGTSVAIVLSVEDIAQDMQTISGRLRESKVGRLTQSLQTDIIEALKELIEATQKEMQDMKSEDGQQQGQSGSQEKPPLVQIMAEIKVLRSLQLRINRRTQRVDAMLAEQSSDERTELLQQLEELTNRQRRLTESAEQLAEQVRQKR